MPFVKNTASKGSQPPPDAHTIFIGRTNELLFFVQNILKPEVPTQNILSISGQGGVGKSTLLARFIEEARSADFQDYCLTSIVDERQATAISMMEHFAHQLHLTGTFGKALKRYKETVHTLQTERETLPHRLLQKTPDFAGAAVEGVPIAGPILREGVKATTAHLLSEHRHVLASGDAEQLEDPLPDLTQAFIKELNQLSDTRVTLRAHQGKRQRRVILFFDTFEQLAVNAVPWLLNYFLPATISSNVVLVFAGRDAIEHATPQDSKRWLPHLESGIIHSMSLHSFSEDEVRVYLATRGITDPDRIATVWQLSRGLPLYLGLLTSNPQGEVDPTENVVDNFLRWIPEQEEVKRQLALDAALFSAPFNQDDLAAFANVPEHERLSLFRWLTRQPFVRPQGGRYHYHDLAQELFSRHLFQRSPKTYTLIRKALADHYQKLLETTVAEGGKHADRSTRRLESVLALVYQLFLLLEEANHVKAIEQVLYAYKHTTPEQEGEIVRVLHKLVQELAANQTHSRTQQAVKDLLRYIEAGLARHNQEVCAAANRLLEQVAHKPSFPAELLASIYDRRGWAHFELKEYQRAVEDFQQAFTLNKVLGSVGLTRSYLGLDEREQAFIYFDRLVELNPDDAWAYERRGWNYQYFREHQLAITDFDHALALDPRNYSAYHGKGWAYFNLGQNQQAILELTRALELNPKLGYAYGCLGLVHQELKEYQQAIASLDRFVEVSPEYDDAYRYRGICHVSFKEYRRALADLDRAIELNPHNSATYLQRGLTYLWLKDQKQASTDFIRGWESDSTHVSCGWMAEWISMSRARPDPGMPERLEALAAANPKHYAAYVCRGVARLLRGSVEEALTELEQASLKWKKGGDAYFWKGLACATLERDEEAVAAVEQALALELPPVLLVPLCWLEQEKPDFYKKYAMQLLTKYELLI